MSIKNAFVWLLPVERWAISGWHPVWVVTLAGERLPDESRFHQQRTWDWWGCHLVPCRSTIPGSLDCCLSSHLLFLQPARCGHRLRVSHILILQLWSHSMSHSWNWSFRLHSPRISGRWSARVSFGRILEGLRRTGRPRCTPRTGTRTQTTLQLERHWKVVRSDFKPEMGNDTPQL